MRDPSPTFADRFNAVAKVLSYVRLDRGFKYQVQWHSCELVDWSDLQAECAIHCYPLSWFRDLTII